MPKEYWAKEPSPLRWLFLIDVSMEAVSRGFLDGFCEGIMNALYGASSQEELNGDDAQVNGFKKKSNLVPGTRIGIATFDKEVHFYSLAASLEHAQMIVMPDIDDPFVPISEGLFVDAAESRAVITSLLRQLPNMFARVKSPEPALLPTLNAALEALKATGKVYSVPTSFDTFSS